MIFIQEHHPNIKTVVDQNHVVSVLTVEEGLGGDEEGGGAHPQQRDELQEPEAERSNGERQKMFKR